MNIPVPSADELAYITADPGTDEKALLKIFEEARYAYPSNSLILYTLCITHA
jgi:hypothetical protein